MTEKELHQEIHNQLFKTGSCTPNKWMFMTIKKGDKVAAFEVILPSKGNIKIRRPIKKQFVNSEGQEVWLYSLMRFTNKQELKDDGLLTDIRLDQKGA